MSPPPEKLIDFVARTQHCSLRKAKALLDTRRVFVNGRRVWMAKHRVTPADRIEIHASVPPTRATDRIRALPVLLDQQDILLIDKPAGILSNGDNSAEALLRTQLQQPLIRAVHRLDKGTSGCLCMARTNTAFERMVQLFRDQRVLKIYRALVSGHPRPHGTCSVPLDGQTAVTHWQVLEQTEGACLLQVKIDTGRTHQIRRHLAHLGHPVLGDVQYATGRVDDRRVRNLPRPMLHAAVFEAPLPPLGHVTRVTAPVPPDFRTAMKSFNFCFDPRGNET